MDQATREPITERLQEMIFRGPLAKYRAAKAQVFPPLVALLLEFAAFASIPLVLIGYLLLAQGASSPASANLNGLWKTQASGYADRYMEISDGVIMFGTGGDTLESYVIKKVEATPDGTNTLYTITYLDRAMNPLRLSFYFQPDGEPLITFKHQDHLTWSRVRE